MNLINAETKVKITNVATRVSDFAELIDADNFNMRTEANLLRDIAQDIGSGLFKILFMGKSRTGKSTLINAFVGKSVMATRATSCTAVMTTVEYGKDINSVRVVYTPESKRKPRVITLSQFTKDFMLTCEDVEQQLDRFVKVSHVERKSDDDFFSGGTCLIDSPGLDLLRLEDRISCTNVMNNYVLKANAIIFTLNAMSLFSIKEREYIADNFAGKHMTNLFFVINRINQLVPGQLKSSVMPSVKKFLKNVFVDENGHFNESLYKRHVFFVDAYGAECSRKGEPYKIRVGNREIDLPIKLEDTGMLNFENELRAFLNSAERINETIISALIIMSSIRDAAKHKLATAKNLREVAIETRQKDLNTARKIINEIRNLYIS